MNSGGNILIDAPPSQNFSDLVRVAGNRRTWKAHGEQKFGRSEKKKSKKQRPKNAKCRDSKQMNNKVGRWIGSGAEAVWAGTAPAPKRVAPTTLSPKAPIYQPPIYTRPSIMTTVTPMQRAERMVQSTLLQAWRITQDKGPNRRSGTKTKSKKVNKTILTDA